MVQSEDYQEARKVRLSSSHGRLFSFEGTEISRAPRCPVWAPDKIEAISPTRWFHLYVSTRPPAWLALQPLLDLFEHLLAPPTRGLDHPCRLAVVATLGKEHVEHRDRAAQGIAQCAPVDVRQLFVFGHPQPIRDGCRVTSMN